MSLFQRSQSVLKAINQRVFASTSRLVKKVEHAVGIEEVRTAQDSVISAEGYFVKSQAARREKQYELSKLQKQLKTVQNQLGKIPRSDERYLDLVTDEHRLLRVDSSLRKELEAFEQAERSAFSELSTALRFSHERERVYGERTKYFSIVGSITGAILGAVATGISGYLRVRELHLAVEASTNQCLQLQEMVGKLENEVSVSSEKSEKFLDEFRQLVGINSAAILLAGVGEEGNQQHRNMIVPQTQMTTNNAVSEELIHLVTQTNIKLNDIETSVARLSPIVEDDSSVSGLVIRCDHVHHGTDRVQLSQEDVASEVDKRLSKSFRSLTFAVGTLAIVSGVAAGLSIIFSLR